ncbi:MAG: hypothetical protein ACFCU8_18615 [Thermosynechococcaceae cyanobacterium]
MDLRFTLDFSAQSHPSADEAIATAHKIPWVSYLALVTHRGAKTLYPQNPTK